MTGHTRRAAPGLIILLAVWLLRGIFGNGANQSGSRALDILDQRFARGEIDREEYEARKKALS